MLSAFVWQFPSMVLCAVRDGESEHKEGQTKNEREKVKLFLPSAGNHTDTCRWADPSPEREREIKWDHERSRGHVVSRQVCFKQVCVCVCVYACDAEHECE